MENYNIWALCEGKTRLQSCQFRPWRVVEAQHILSARDLVESSEEHNLLEELLETVKPPIVSAAHYLIFTPFRYPPLKYGSRFGSVFEPSLWFGSELLSTAFAEVAHYRFKFFKDTEAALGDLELTMTAFQAFVQSEQAVNLTEPPFDDFRNAISSPETHQYSQTLGQAMREDGVSFCIYYSARTKELAKNIAIFNPDAFYTIKNQYTDKMQTWISYANKSTVEFTRINGIEKQKYVLSAQDFSVF